MQTTKFRVVLSKIITKFYINRFLFNISIKSRLLLYFIILILLPTAIISITLYNKSTSIIVQKINSSLEDKLNMIDLNIKQKFESINNIANEIYLNPELIDILSRQHPYDQAEIINEMSSISKLLNNYSYANIAQPLLIPRIYILNRPEYLLYSFTDNVSDISSIEKDNWYMHLPSNTSYSVVGHDIVSISSQTINTLKIAKRLYGLDDMHVQFAGVLTIDVSVNDFRSILSSSKPTIGSSTFIVDHNNMVVLSHDMAILGKELGNEKYFEKIFAEKKYPFGSFIQEKGNNDILVSYKKIDTLDWTIVSLTPMKELNRELVSFNRIIFIVIAVCCVVALLMALLLSDNISYPIRKLVDSMTVVQSGNFNISLEYKRNDEFAYLFNSYKNMVNRINDLINKLYLSEVIKKEAELKSLQAQINPHFLYNTLDSVNWMALELNATNISTMVTSLSNFFRYSLSKGKSIITLDNEKTQVESYLKIQKIRFQERLDYTIDFQKEVLDYLTVKLVLQPLVENSILHGFNRKQDKGVINIIATNSDSIIEIQITDNGIGADVDEINSILKDKSDTSSFAIKNVNDRIKHYFGNEFGLRYYNNESSGITVVIRFPAVKTMKGLGLYVENDYCG